MPFSSPVIFRITRVPASSLKYLLKAFDIFLNLFQLTGSLERHLYQPRSSEVAKLLWNHCSLLISMFQRAPAHWPPNPVAGRRPLIICSAFCLCLHLKIPNLNLSLTPWWSKLHNLLRWGIQCSISPAMKWLSQQSAEALAGAGSQIW